MFSTNSVLYYFPGDINLGHERSGEWKTGRVNGSHPAKTSTVPIYIYHVCSISVYCLALLTFIAIALVTYVLLAAVQAGLNAQFNPEILGITSSKALAVVLIEFLFVKLGCYFLNIPGQTQVIDLVAYGGYKFVG